MRLAGLVAFGASIAFAASAAAAPFCVVASFGKQCYYYDYPSCERAAAQARGACVVGDDTQQPQQQTRSAPQGPPFCVVASYGSQCFYWDAPSCQRAAASAGGACVVNPNR